MGRVCSYPQGWAINAQHTESRHCQEQSTRLLDTCLVILSVLVRVPIAGKRMTKCLSHLSIESGACILIQGFSP